MTVISADDLSLSFGVNTVLENISFSLDEKDKMGIIGVNGCGKSTLFRLILGEYEPDSGNVYISKGKSIGILRQDSGHETYDGQSEKSPLELMYGAFPELLEAESRLAELEHYMTIGSNDGIMSGEAAEAEYVALHERFVRDGGLEFRSRCASILMKMGFDEASVNRPICTLSGGQRTRLALSKQLCREPDILMLDEPTNHLDTETLGWLENYLIAYRKCVMVISHDRYFLDRVTNKTLVIEHKHAKLYNGGYSQSIEQRKTDTEIAEKHWRLQQAEIARQEAYISQQRAWNRERNIIAAESRQKRLDKMVRLDRPQTPPKAIKMSFCRAEQSGNDVLYVKDLGMSFGTQRLFSGLNFLIKKGERVFIVGPNGCGKSTLIKIIIGSIVPTEGRVEAGYNVEVGYYDQENQNLNPENTVLEELWSAYPKLTETKIRNTLAMFGFTGEQVHEKTVAVLSGGERARLTLAKLILSHMNLLILDEPTNHLDIDSRETLETALEQYDGTVLVVSHDRYLIDKLATRIIELRPYTDKAGGILDYRVSDIGSGYSEMQSYKAAREAERVPASAVKETVSGSSKEQYLENKKNISDRKKQQKMLERMKKEAEELEAELAEIEKEMFGEAASDYKRVAELDTRKNQIEERLLELYETIG